MEIQSVFQNISESLRLHPDKGVKSGIRDVLTVYLTVHSALLY